MNIGHILFSFDGRINRGKFWLGYLLGGIISMVFIGIAHVDAALGSDDGGRTRRRTDSRRSWQPKLNLENVSWGIPSILFGIGLLLSSVHGLCADGEALP